MQIVATENLSSNDNVHSFEETQNLNDNSDISNWK